MYVPPEVLRWIFVQIIGTQNALKTSGLVSERRIVRCVEEAEKDYDRMLAEKRNQAAGEFADAIGTLAFMSELPRQAAEILKPKETP